ncbi:hypothetical protein [Bartonella sp. WD12.1]|uniref:hypothetical protein n=1 Tax=Bartonella sp. WD12.1 TaxID=1933903 RepID=UPI00130195E8|nr:hypothetical protein [Bartonella sp. WD12.1]
MLGEKIGGGGEIERVGWRLRGSLDYWWGFRKSEGASGLLMEGREDKGKVELCQG